MDVVVVLVCFSCYEFGCGCKFSVFCDLVSLYLVISRVLFGWLGWLNSRLLI